ncbi:MAG TPA: hypothetical protein VI894_01195 [Candidatus Nanoarchaeia archaeon]|nr:hypothetical protein [Candidatus Nanoarchaeia archaeon]
MTNTNADIWSVINTTAQLCPGIINGNCTLYYSATNNASNANTTTKITITIDDNAPAVTGLKINDSTTVKSTSLLNVTVNVSDANINTVYLFNGSGIPRSTMIQQGAGELVWYSLNTTSEMCSGVLNGICVLRVNVTDATGNWNDNATLNLTVGNTSPLVKFPNTNLTIAGNKTKSGWPINFSINVTDFGSPIIKVTLYNGSGNPVSTMTNINTDIWYVVNTTAQICSGITNGNCTLTFSATNNLSNVNNSINISIVVDDAVPAATAFSANKSSYLKIGEPINFTVNITDMNAETVYLIGPGSNRTTMTYLSGILWQATNTSTDICYGITNATCTLRANATDSTGNYNDTTTLQLIIDNIVPFLNVTAPLNASNIINFNVTFAFTVSDTNLNTCWYNIDNTANKTISCTNATTVLATPAGWHTITVFANDSANNLNFSATTFFTNNTAPLISILSPVNNRTYNNSMILVDVLFNSTPQWINESVDGAISAICFSNCSTSYSHNLNLSTGNHSFFVFISDFFGNLANSTQINFTVIIPDTVPPNITIISPINGGIYDVNPIAINLSVNETAQNVSIRIDFGNLTYLCWNCSTAFNLSTLADGNHTLFATATDFANNSETDNVTFLVDATFPVIYEVRPVNGTYIGKYPSGISADVFNITYTETNVRQVVFYLKNSTSAVFSEINLSCSSGNMKSCLYTPNLTALNLFNGDLMDFRFMIKDNTHAVYSNITRVVVADVIPLTINLTSPVNGTYNVSRIPLTVVLNKQAEKITRAIDNDFYSILCSNCNAINTNLSYSQGWHTLKIRAYNYDDTYVSAEATLFVDSLAPSISFISPANNSYVNNVTTFTLKYTEANPMNVTLVIRNSSGILKMQNFSCPWGSQQTCSDSVNLNAYNGMQVQFYFSLTDGSFFINTTPRTIYVDSTSPLMTIASPQNTSYKSTKVEIKVSTNEQVYNLKMAIDSSPYQIVCTNCQTYAKNMSLTQGNHSLRFLAIDYSGNTDNENVTFMVDSIAPRIISIAPANNSRIRTNANFSVKYTEVNPQQAKLVIKNSTSIVYEANISSCIAGTSKTCLQFVNLTSFEGKKLSYYFVLSDNLLNTTSMMYDIFVDSIAPVITVLSPTNKTYNTTIVILNVSVNENLSTLKMAVDSVFFSNACTNCNSTVRKLYLNQGAHTVRLIATDFSGNSNSTEITLFVDSVKPSIISYSPLNKSYVKNTTTFSIRYSEVNLKKAVLVIRNSTAVLQQINMSCDAGNFKLCSVNVDLSQYNSNTLYYYFNLSDEVFTVQTQGRTLYVDSTPPVLNVISPLNANYTSRTILFNLTTEEKVKNIKRSIDDAPYSILCSNCNLTKSTIYFSKGAHTAVLQATDYADNTITVTRQFVIS